MSIPVTKPCQIQYSPRSSGDIQTGEIQHVRGGGRLASIYSGILAGASLASAPGAVALGPGVYFYSGAGRLNTVTTMVGLTSGVGINFFDSATVASGMVNASGHKFLWRLPAIGEFPGNTTNSGALTPVAVYNVDAPFQSGLAVGAWSGCPGFSVSWTPEVNSNWPNN